MGKNSLAVNNSKRTMPRRFHARASSNHQVHSSGIDSNLSIQLSCRSQKTIRHFQMMVRNSCVWKDSCFLLGKEEFCDEQDWSFHETPKSRSQGRALFIVFFHWRLERKSIEFIGIRRNHQSKKETANVNETQWKFCKEKEHNFHCTPKQEGNGQCQ